MRRQRLISELRIDLAHGLVRLVVRGEHGPQTLCSRAQERLDFDRDRQTAAAVIAPDPGHPGIAVARFALSGRGQSGDRVAVVRDHRRIGDHLTALEGHLTEALEGPVRRRRRPGDVFPHRLLRSVELTNEALPALAVVAIDDLLDRPKHDARAPDLVDTTLERSGIEGRELDVRLDAPTDLAEPAFRGPLQGVWVRVARASEEPRGLAPHRFVDDHSEQCASYSLAAIRARDRHPATLASIGMRECAAVAEVGHRGNASRLVLDDKSKQRIVWGHLLPDSPLLGAALLHRAVPGVPLDDPRLPIALFERTRAVALWEARRQAVGVHGDHPRDDRGGVAAVKSPRYVPVTAPTPRGCEQPG